jgi:hypothetical protein
MALVGALGLFSVLALVLAVPHTVAALVAGVPFAVVVAWAVFLKQGRPAGYDRDLIEYWLIGGDFTRIPDERGGRPNEAAATVRPTACSGAI